MEMTLISAIIILFISSVLFIIEIKKLSHITIFFITAMFIIAGAYHLITHPLFSLSSAPSSSGLLFISIIILLGVSYSIRTSKSNRQTIAHLKSLQEIERSILSGLSHKGTLNLIIKTLNRTLKTDASAILILDQSDLKPKHLVSDNLTKRFEEYLNKKNNNNYISSTIHQSKPIIIPKISLNEKEEFLQRVMNEGFSSYFASPIIMKGGMPIGALTLYSQKPKKYSPDEKRLIQTISSQIGILLDRTRLIKRIQEMNFESVRALVEAIESRDPYTRGHSIQVADLAFRVAKAMDFTHRELTLIEFAGLLHDVGKIAIPEMILQKASELNDEEWKVIKKHTLLSAKIIEPISNLKPIQNWILYHHERWDGKGYPDGKKEKEIPLQSRILAVCDTYSAMTGNRPYRKALSIEETKEEIISVAGTQLDPDIVEVFLNTVFNNKKPGGSTKRKPRS